MPSSVRVNVAVLSIAAPSAGGNVAMENIVADRLTEAGHQVAAFEAVKDAETPIRSQLTGWLADPDIDVVVVIGESEAIPVALKPLIDQSLPGFADLLRMLAYQEIGASAMHSHAEAARCGTTFVFVLPANENAVTAAMEKLILPQLDPKTKPRNLIGSMPRLRDAVEHDVTKVDVARIGAPPSGIDVTRVDLARTESARVESTRGDSTHADSIPTPIAMEKTETGAGVKPKLPAGRAEPVAADRGNGQRPRSRTGANVIVRKVEDPTKPIELQRLEQQLALSKDDETKVAPPATTPPATTPPARPPRTTPPAHPPGTTPPATITPAARANIATRPLDVGNLRAPATPNANAKPLPSITAKSAPAASSASSASDPSVGDATKPFELTKPTAPIVPDSIIATPKSRSAAKRPSDLGDATKPMDLGRLPKMPPGADQASLESDDTDQIISPPPKDSPAAAASAPSPTASTAPSGGAIARIQLKPASVATPPRGTTPSPSPASASTSPASTSPATRPARVRQPTPPPPVPGTVIPLRKRAAIVEDDAVETLDLEPEPESPPAVAVAAAASTAPAMAATATPSVETTTANIEDTQVASSALLDAPVPVRRKPTEPPPNLSELISSGPSISELPRGEFVYPELRKSRAPLVIGLLLLSALIGGGAMWLLNRGGDDEPRAAVAEPVAIDAAVDAAATVVVEIDAAQVAAVEPDAAEPEVIEVEPPDAAAPVEEPVAKPVAKPATRPATRPVARPTPTEPAAPPPDKPDKPAIVAEPGCEEVACVLEKYARPCCARFKPKSETFVPSVGNGDELSKAQIKAGVDKMKARVIACAEQHPAKGTVKLSIGVDSEGSVKELSVVTAPDDALGECVAGVMRKAKFAQTANGGAFTYPFVF